MYCEYYKFKSLPFAATAEDTLPGGTFGRTLTKALNMVAQQRGTCLVLTAPGLSTATTELLRTRLAAQGATVLPVFAAQSAIELLADIVRQLQLPLPAALTEDALRQELRTGLLAQAAKGKRVLVMISEAQELGGRALEALRLLGNWEAGGLKLLAIVLLADAQGLEAVQAQPKWQALLQRVTGTVGVEGMNEEETGAYIEQRLGAVALPGCGVSFSAAAKHDIWRASGGVPSLINQLCDGVLAAQFAQRTVCLDKSVVAQVLQETGWWDVHSSVAPAAPDAVSAPVPAPVAPPAPVVAPAAPRSLDALVASIAADDVRKTVAPVSAAPAPVVAPRSLEALRASLAEDTGDQVAVAAPLPVAAPAEPRRSFTSFIKEVFQDDQAAAPEAAAVAAAVAAPVEAPVTAEPDVSPEPAPAAVVTPAIAVHAPDAEFSDMVVAHHDRAGSAAEEYRALRSSLLAAHPGGKLQLMVTSSQAGEGKTTTAMNLAVVLTEYAEQTVLLVDCDLRGAQMTDHMKVQRSPGLAEVLRGEATLDQAIQATAYPNLFFLAAGNATEAEIGKILESSRLKEVLAGLRGKYTHMILDACAIGVGSDAMDVGIAIGEALLVVRMYKTRRESVDRTVRLLRSANVTISGLTLTGRKYFIPSLLYRHL